MRLEVPCYVQEEPWSCLAACVRMCLSATGDCRAESEWRSLIGTQQQGTALTDAYAGLTAAGFEVDLVTNGSPDQLVDSITDSRPVIIGILSGTAQGRLVTHAIVIVGILEDAVIGIDPALGTERTWESDELGDLWSFAGGRGLVMPAI